MPEHHQASGRAPNVASDVLKANTKPCTVSMISARGAPEMSANAPEMLAWIGSAPLVASEAFPNWPNRQCPSVIGV
ncbi:hypothetical protein D3C86_1430090 [compost metagenome]